MIKYLLFALLLFAAQARAEENNSALEKQINLTFEKKAQVDLELAKADESVHQLETLIRERRKILLERARGLSYLKDFKWGALFAIDDPTAFERNLKILSKLNQYDLALFKDYKSSIRNLAQGRQDLISYKKELETVLADLKKQEENLHEKEEIRSKSLIVENRKSLLLLKGKMPPPTEGQIQWNFGSYKDKQNQFAFLIRGLLFKTATYQPIHAIGPGKVIFRDVIPYWGETLIVQHDDNYYSVYAGVLPENKLFDEIKINDVIARAQGIEFYFELRHFENPINPKNWLKENL